MFQYALGRRLSIEYQTNLALDVNAFSKDPLRSYRLHNFQLGNHRVLETTFSPGLRSLVKRVGSSLRWKDKRYLEPHFHYDERVLQVKSGILRGYWQSEKYFSSIRQILLQDFSPKRSPRSEILSILKDIDGCEAVSIHVRRGDYVNNINALAYHGLVNVNWYLSAINHIKERVSDARFFIFSDDIGWVKHNFPATEDFRFIDASPDGFEHEDMLMMSRCKHQIIANSSFSWWAAWLNVNVDKVVVAPKQWFQNQTVNTNDLLPVSWLRF